MRETQVTRRCAPFRPAPGAGAATQSRWPAAPAFTAEIRARRDSTESLPRGAYCAGLARENVRTLLTRHGLTELVDTAVLAASELVSAACRFPPNHEMILRVRRQCEALRIVLYDQHPAHDTPAGAEECRDRRSRSMWLPAAAVDAHGGDWGLDPGITPGGGTNPGPCSTAGGVTPLLVASPPCR
ncbi:hypothetical protein [Streptomyces sp. NPDC101115]|uniref:hypothetical protein n=1 Tax=Streptomyces sp. NPDC101115 TaxID=3366106 RepID=UPI0038129AE4